MNKGAILSPCGQYRYQLWRIWNEDKPLVMFICLNPSTADARQDDPTLRRIMSFVYQLGYGGFYLGNLFAFRCTDPDRLRFAKDPIGDVNDPHLLLMCRLCQDIVFAWGNQGTFMKRNLRVTEMFPSAMCLGKSRFGHPKHPLYLSKDTQLIPFK